MKLSFAKKIAFVLCFSYVGLAMAQPGTSIDLEKEKPEKYKEKLLNSEKTPDKKIGFLKRFANNTITHYNYYYNSTVKLDEILERAKSSFVDDYTQLLPFYNYSLSATAQDKDIDSIIHKCNAGILLHDLRSDWVDDMYMLLGKAYMLRKNFDSAYYVFQYLNYIYAPKDDGYDVPIGSNESNEEGIFTVATNEKKRKLLSKIFTKPLKRNDALVWLVRNYLEEVKTGEASGLLQILQNDPAFPKRLKTDLYEMISYNYYLTKQYDSSASYLEKCLSNTDTRAERGRWEFLIGQMYQLAGQEEKAIPAYEKSIKHSSNPVIEIYAHLNMIMGLTDTTKKVKPRSSVGSVGALTRLAKKERYQPYKDIIYYAAGQLSLQENDVESAVDYFKKSATSSVDNPKQKSKSFLALADAEYILKKYKAAYSDYDSVAIADVDKESAIRINERKPALKIISDNLDAIQLQDSLQALAKLPANELNSELKKIYKKYKKAKGLKDDGDSFDFGSDNNAITNSTSDNLFATDDGKEGSFYFENNSLKSNGLKEFKSKWGNRPNVDNWNRAGAVVGKVEIEKKINEEKANAAKQSKSASVVKGRTPKDARPIDLSPGNPDMDNPEDQIQDSRKGATKEVEEPEITPESLFAAIPLSEDKIQASNEIIINALFGNGETFSNQLEDYPSAIDAYEELLRRFAKNKHTEQTLFNLSYCYKKANKPNKADAAKEKLDLAFGDGALSSVLKEKTANAEKDAATKKYAGIYNMFLEGKYIEAKAEKAAADSVYRQKYWNPQLSFIEAVYYIKQQQDSIAIDRLTLIVNGNAEPQLQEKAKLMIDVLKRRKQIEEHLASLDSNGVYDSTLVARNAAIKDSLAKLPAKEDEYVKDMSLLGKPFVYNPNEPHYAVLLLEKVDDVFLTETKKSFVKYNYDNYTGKPPVVQLAKLNKDYTLVLLGPLSSAANGLNYVDKTKPQTTKILPWLPSFKYTYTLIGVSNLDILRVNDNLADYKKFLKGIFPNKF